MIPDRKRKGLIGQALGFGLLALGVGLSFVIADAGSEFAKGARGLLLLSGGLVFPWGVYQIMRGKGYDPALSIVVAVFGLSLIGLLVFVFLPDKEKDTAVPAG